jgi:hypothetical protein
MVSSSLAWLRMSSSMLVWCSVGGGGRGLLDGVLSAACRRRTRLNHRNMVTSCRARGRGGRGGTDDRRWRVVVVSMAIPRSVGVGVRGAVWKSKSRHMAALKHSRLELWRLERPMSPRPKTMVTHASIVEQVQGNHDKLCLIPGIEHCIEHCNEGLTL